MYMKEYDYLVVGAGLFAAVFVRQAIDAGKRCLVIDNVVISAEISIVRI